MKTISLFALLFMGTLFASAEDAQPPKYVSENDTLKLENLSLKETLTRERSEAELREIRAQRQALITGICKSYGIEIKDCVLSQEQAGIEDGQPKKLLVNKREAPAKP